MFPHANFPLHSRREISLQKSKPAVSDGMQALVVLVFFRSADW